MSRADGLMSVRGKPQSLSVVLPCWNEELNIGAAVRDAERAARGLFEDFEIIVVDDGSRDGTGARARELAARDRNIKVVSHPRNRGYGAALRSGFACSTKDLVFFTDADGQFDMEELGRLVPLMADCDIAVGYRARRRDGFVRRVNGFLWTKWAGLILGFRAKDVDCAFKLFRGSVLKSLPLKSAGAAINAEILAWAARKGLVLRELGVRHYPRAGGRPSGARIGVVLKALGDLARLKLALGRESHDD
jgi:glycosyltransferase involved in cell wall biosynthesis